MTEPPVEPSPGAQAAVESTSAPEARASAARHDGKAVAAGILGIVAVVFAVIPILDLLGVILAVLAIVLGVLSRNSMDEAPSPRRRWATAGIVLGIVAIVLAVVMYFVFRMMVNSMFEGVTVVG